MAPAAAMDGQAVAVVGPRCRSVEAVPRTRYVERGPGVAANAMGWSPRRLHGDGEVVMAGPAVRARTKPNARTTAKARLSQSDQALQTFHSPSILLSVSATSSFSSGVSVL
ncbi:hypothetical protein C7458_107238 [Williamsia muralis]|nr:hypothetical protein C7458_107238 [Williamsia marianensis]